ncbi:45070_t:CDS:2, partial [Gigaspora margarita]
LLADNNQLPQNTQELLFDKNIELLFNKLLLNEYEELSPNEYKQLSPNEYKQLSPIEYKELSFNKDDKFSSYKNNKLLLCIVSQFLHLVKDYGYNKMLASKLLARSINKGLWHARVIHIWANQ